MPDTEASLCPYGAMMLSSSPTPDDILSPPETRGKNAWSSKSPVTLVLKDAIFVIAVTAAGDMASD